MNGISNNASDNTTLNNLLITKITESSKKIILALVKFQTFYHYIFPILMAEAFVLFSNSVEKWNIFLFLSCLVFILYIVHTVYETKIYISTTILTVLVIEVTIYLLLYTTLSQVFPNIGHRIIIGIGITILILLPIISCRFHFRKNSQSSRKNKNEITLVTILFIGWTLIFVIWVIYYHRTRMATVLRVILLLSMPLLYFIIVVIPYWKRKFPKYVNRVIYYSLFFDKVRPDRILKLSLVESAYMNFWLILLYITSKVLNFKVQLPSIITISTVFTIVGSYVPSAEIRIYKKRILEDLQIIHIEVEGPNSIENNLDKNDHQRKEKSNERKDNEKDNIENNSGKVGNNVTEKGNDKRRSFIDFLDRVYDSLYYIESEENSRQNARGFIIGTILIGVILLILWLYLPHLRTILLIFASPVIIFCFMYILFKCIEKSNKTSIDLFIFLLGGMKYIFEQEKHKLELSVNSENANEILFKRAFAEFIKIPYLFPPRSNTTERRYEELIDGIFDDINFEKYGYKTSTPHKTIYPRDTESEGSQFIRIVYKIEVCENTSKK